MKNIFAVIVLMAITGCSRLDNRYVCDCDELKELQTFVRDGIKPANNMSDEEMEDVIKELRITGVKIFCKLKPVWVTPTGAIDWEKQTFDSCGTIMTLY